MSVEFAVFVKPWKRLSLAELAPHIRKLGFDLIELPVRPGFPCEPDQIESRLPQTVKQLRKKGYVFSMSRLVYRLMMSECMPPVQRREFP